MLSHLCQLIAPLLVSSLFADEPEGYVLANLGERWVQEGGRVSLFQCKKLDYFNPTQWTLEFHVYPGDGSRGFYEV